MRLSDPVHTRRQHPVLVLHAQVDAVVDRLDLAVTATRADQEVVGDGREPPQIQLDDVDRLAVGGKLRDCQRDLFG